ncbi:MAG TPA: PSD1 and planctomycete cytochrome C domain-containing protein [Fimbriimonas sp.]|nr:PSD1 and planctomycete cytochrome C domain-containing protein [Fimbriimonas sp.]
MMQLRSIGLVVSSFICLGVGLAMLPAQSRAKRATPPPRVVDYNREVRPILSESCFKCHGPDAKFVKSNLRLPVEADVFKDRGGYKVITKGKPHESELMNRIKPGSSAPMPPKDSDMAPLTKEQVETLRLWIAQGAKYEKHWAYVTPKMPRVTGPYAMPIDNLVAAKLASKGLKMEPKADRNTLLRRASLTLTGLLPTTEELLQFKNDASPNAYEKALDRLLASERYGEHQARYWLDAVRYGDTHGLHLDNERSIYPYRDWVVRAYNQDLSFDKFTIWQMAGDLLPNPTTEQLIATGYIRMNPTTSEGGAIEEEFLVKNTFDRVDTTSTVFLGQTTACAKCHDHKYDPISAKDYYSLFAYFNSTKDSPFDNNSFTHEPTMLAPSPEEDGKLTADRNELKKIEEQVDAEKAMAWLASVRMIPPKIGKWEFFLTKPIVGSFDVAFDQEETPTAWKEIKIDPGVANNFIPNENSNAYLRTKITADEPRELTLRVGSDDGLKVWLNGKLVHSNKILRGAEQAPDIFKIQLPKGESELLFKIVNSGGQGGIKFNYGNVEEAEIETAFTKKDVASAKRLMLLYSKENSSPAYSTVRQRVMALEQTLPRTFIAQEADKPRDAFILNRGEYDQRREKVGRAIPSAWGKLPQGAPNNRLGLAQWLVDPSNPLVSRVIVNRMWQQHFGVGLVRTAEDFGNQGEWPSNPELLDYLAVKFIKSGWSVKALHKEMLMSQAFQQSSKISAQKLRIDPENRLTSRGPRFRLDIEVIRDKALQLGGLLVQRQGGRGFKPYQPAGLWEEVGFESSTTSKYVQDMNSDIYRRTLYLFWKRTSPHPVMSSFDAPSREACVVRRPTTNTPLQALITMNEPAFVEAARKFGERIYTTKANDAARIDFAFRSAFGRSPSAEEARFMMEAYQTFRADFTKRGEAEAKKVIKTGLAPADPSVPAVEGAAWTLIANTLMNTDEFLTQH